MCYFPLESFQVTRLALSFTGFAEVTETRLLTEKSSWSALLLAHYTLREFLRGHVNISEICQTYSPLLIQSEEHVNMPAV